MALFTGCMVLILIGWIALYRQPMFLCFFLVLFTFAWRTTSSMYIDLFGPIYASQIELFIGPGVMTAFQSIAYFLTIIPFFWFFSPAACAQWIREAGAQTEIRPSVTLSDVTFYASLVFMALLIAAFIQGGVFPIFARMERWIFNEQAGVLHQFILKRGDFVCFWWGTMFAAEKLRHSRIDYRFLGLLALLIVYTFLAGGRFSPFYRYCSFFIMPWSAVVLLQLNGVVSAGLRGIGEVATDRRLMAVSAGIVAMTISMIVFALYWNLTQVRGFEEEGAKAALFERSLVQPTELGWVSYRRIFVYGQWNPQSTFDFLFERPIASGRNTTPQFLMSETIGEPRATELTQAGFQFAGGFPEIYFELFGPYLGWLFVLGAGWICAAISGLMVRSVLRGEYLVAVCAFQILYALYIMYIGGMLNFAFVPTFWMKMTLLFIAIAAEHRFRSAGLVLLPWVVVDQKRILWFRRKQIDAQPLS